MFEKLTTYYTELSELKLNDFNKFIFTKILAKALKFNTIVPILAALSVVAFSVALQTKYYVFIPQSSITAFASYVIFASVTSLLILVMYPLAIIIILNYIGFKVRGSINRLFVPLKLIILTASFFLCIYKMAAGMPLAHKIYVTLVWVLLYFILVNFYIAYSRNDGKLIFSKFRIFFLVLFVGLSIKPFTILFIFTSEMINYTSIDSNIYLNQNACDLVSTPIGNKDRSANMAIYRPEILQKIPGGGCYLRDNSIRYGFGGDYVLNFKKNVEPITNSSHEQYNVYVRLTCYANNCYAEDNIIIANDKDSQNSLILANQRKKLRQMHLLD